MYPPSKARLSTLPVYPPSEAHLSVVPVQVPVYPPSEVMPLVAAFQSIKCCRTTITDQDYHYGRGKQDFPSRDIIETDRIKISQLTTLVVRPF